MSKQNGIKIVRAWIGFSDGKPHSYQSCAEDLKTVWAVFKTRKEGREAYEDVRRCDLVIRTNRGTKHGT